MRKFVATLGLLLLVLPNLFALDGYQGGNLVKLFLEDFGGNSPDDPIAKGSGIPQCTYNYNDNPKGSGNYAIRKIGWDHNQWYYPFYDHTFPGDGTRGYMLQADGSNSPGTFYKTTVDGLCAGSTIYAYFWGCSATHGMGYDAFLSLIVKTLDGEVLGKKDVTLYNKVGLWQEYGVYITLPANATSIIYEVTNNSSQSSGNDFFLDDVGVSLCMPPTQVDVPGAACLGNDFILTGKYENNGVLKEPLYYRWMYSETGSLNEEWETLSVADKPELKLSDVSASSEGYYRLAVGSVGDEANHNNASISEPVKVEVRDCSEPALYPQNDVYTLVSCDKGSYVFDILENDDIDVDDFTVEILDNSRIADNSAEIVDNKLVYTLGKAMNNTDVVTYVLKSGNISRKAVVTISIKRKYQTFIADTICQGSSYTFAGQEYKSSTITSTSLVAANGCDSVVSLNLHVRPRIETNVSTTAPSGTSYTFGTKTITEDGTYTETFTTEQGCDSLVTLDIRFEDFYVVSVEENICQGEFYQFGENRLDKAGVYTETFKAANGSDSIVTLTLTVLPNVANSIAEKICQGESYTLGSQVLTESGVYTEVFKAANGCDSTVTLNLQVLESQSTVVDAAICTGASYTFGTQKLTEAGTYTLELKSVSGCDSVVTLNLQVLESLKKEISASICMGETYTFGDEEIAESGVYTQSFKSAAGCDSIVTLTLTVGTPYHIAFTDTICEGEAFNFAGEDKQLSVGNHELVNGLTSAGGCDSTVVMNVAVLPASRTSVYDTVVVNTVYSNYGFSLGELSSVGSVEHVLRTNNLSGCDSVVTLHLCVVPLVDLHDIPTAFSPANADGSNDVFMKGYDLFIYDRYGNLICHSANGWDGRYRGQFADPGVYVYFVTMKDGKKRKGTIEVLKN